MKKIFKKNQFIVTFLAVLIAVAGYLNYADNLDKKSSAKEANNDTDFYTLLTGKFLLDRSILESDADFSKDKDLTKELAAIRECIGATILKGSGERDVPILTNYVQGRPYNYYRDFDGVFIHNSLTNLRSESYPNIDCIPEEVEELIKNYPF